MRVAAIDIGTNSVLLLVAERRGDALVPVLERATITRLGQGVDASRALDASAVDRTLTCLAGYAEEIRRAGVDRAAAVGTSAMRDASGGDAFVARATEILGLAPRVISGVEEAELTFAGALAGLGLAGPVIVFDLGGGSTEVIAGSASGAIAQAVSLDVGSVRLTERHVRGDPPAPGEIVAVREDVRRALAPLGEASFSPTRSTLVGVAGTVTTLAAFALGVVPYDGARVHGARLTSGEVSAAAGKLARITLAERRALPAIEPKRADVIVAGAFIVDEIVAWSGAGGLVVSDRGVRWGLAQRLA